MKNYIKYLSFLMTVFLMQVTSFPLMSYSGIQETTQPDQTGVPAETVEMLRAIYEDNEFASKSFSADWVPDGSGYMLLENVSGENKQELVIYDAASDSRTVVVASSNLAAPDLTGPFTITNYNVSADGNWILVQARNRNERRSDSHYWMVDRKSGTLQKLKAGRNGSISPDGQSILFTEGGNLFVYDIQNDNTIQLTHDAVDGSVSNGRAVWSPDGNRIAFVQSDVSRIKFRSMLVPGDPTYPGVRETRYARVGGTIATLTVGVVDAQGKKNIWLPIPVPTEGHYLGQVSWAGNSDEVLVEKLSRFRDKREFILASVNNGTITTIFEESDPAWVVASYNTNGGVEWNHDYSKFLVLSEKDGWRHAYLCSRDGETEKLLTPGDYDIIDRLQMDETNGWFYYLASPDNATQRYLYRVKLDGTGKPERITPMDQPGTHSYNVSPDSKWAFHTYSTANKPPVTELVQLPKHRLVQMFEGNEALHEKIESLQFQPKEFFQVEISNEVEIDGWMIKPKDFDPSRKYPVFIYVYGEPHGTTVMDSWGHAMANYHRAIADMGYIVISMDNRGTPAPKGAAWRRAIAGRLGPLSTEEQAEGLKEFGRTRPHVDLSRVGIWGWSGGGSNTLNALFRKPDDYHLGIAVVPKPIPHLYNAWFQEIYMNTREVNPEGYEVSAPINFAEGLEGDLLIISGTGETNTHIQIVEGLVDRLIELGKQFDYIAYPNRNHGLREGEGTALHVRVHMARYILDNLPAGPQ